MTATTTRGFAGFRLPSELEAAQPPELTLGRRDAVRMMVSTGRPPRHTTARDLATWLRPGDLLVVNTSATMPAASKPPPPMARRRRPPVDRAAQRAAPRRGPAAAPRGATRPGSADRRRHARRRRRRHLTLLGRMPASVRCGWPRSTCRPAARAPRPPRPADPLPLRARIVADRRVHEHVRRQPGSAEMPSAGRALTAEVDHRPRRPRHRRRPDRAAHRRGLAGGPRGAVPRALPGAGSTARLVNATHAAGGRVIAIGTTVVRALETASDEDGPSTRARAGPTWSSRPSAACGSSTAC